MKLLSIYIAGFQSLNRAAYVEFAGGDISVIYGDNGCGKTTFLKLIHSILSGMMSRLQAKMLCMLKSIMRKIMEKENLYQ